MPLHLADDQMCYVCGPKNRQGFRLRFEHPKKGCLKTSVIFSKQHQGYKDIVHGGLVATLLDEMMVNLAWKEGVPAVTAELRVRLKKPVRVGERVYLEGALNLPKGRGRAFSASATAKNAQGQLLASASATCVRIQIEVD